MLRFDNRFVRELPGEADSVPQPHPVLGACWSHVHPTPVSAPVLLAHSPEAAALLDLSPEEIASAAWLAALAGNDLLPGMQPYAACYGGHQFGHWAGQLGDGRAITLAEGVNARDERWELQLKGAGPTPYSRHADGRAVLRSSVREFLCSEAMFHLGVPTTRALSLVATGDQVMRDMFYDGRAALEPGAVVCRLSPSFLRFGNFELPASREDLPLLERLVDFTIDRDFPGIAALNLPPDERRARFFVEVCERTARMIVEWMRVGFVHGVMNTDNMSILGLTIDYGPYGFLDDFDPGFTPNTTDAQGRRYRYGAQPQMALWNLQCLASALAPLFDRPAVLEAGLSHYASTYSEQAAVMWARKLGLTGHTPEDDRLVQDVLALLQRAELDMTLFFRGLADLDLHAPGDEAVADAFYSEALRSEHAAELSKWLGRYSARSLQEEGDRDARRARMNAVNPRFLPRNYLTQQAIEQAQTGDLSSVRQLLDVWRRPYEDQPEHADLAARRPEWARHAPGCAMLSCSS